MRARGNRGTPSGWTASAARPRGLAAALAEQVDSNRSAVGHEASFAQHRARLTAEIAARAPDAKRGRLCLLGAGNAYDVDLPALAACFAEIHLVDIDRPAALGAMARVPPAVGARLVAHAPLDVSGMFDRLDVWSRTPPPSDTLGAVIDSAVERVAAALPGPFDVVVSCSLLTQLQLVLVQVVGDANPRFDELRDAFNRAHMRTLGALLAPDGVGLLVTDLTGSAIHPPLDDLPEAADLQKVMSDVLAAGAYIYAAHPGRLTSEMRRDPRLNRVFELRYPIGPWIWRNGPTQSFLVYGVEIRRRAASP
ncbi:MAG TPA: hypothetical protein VHM31_10100 [Polyangia bacterium]|nr:hypothetical protein [Polyangia bacterium]